jgi:hypothetical protein
MEIKIALNAMGNEFMLQIEGDGPEQCDNIIE